MNKRKKPKMGKARRNVIIVVSVVLVIGFSFLFIPAIQFDMMQTTGGGEFDIQLMGVSVRNPYNKAEQVVVFSNGVGKAFVDGTRTTWHEDFTQTHWDNFDDMDEDALGKPAYIKNVRPGINYDYGWNYGPPADYVDWNNENTWLSSEGCTFDPDAVNTGVPDLSISIANLYPSDSLGHPRADYGYFISQPRTLVDPEGNVRPLEIHYGFVTLQILFAVTGDSHLDVSTSNDITGYVGEQVGTIKTGADFWNTLGCQLDFSAVFRFQINSLGFDDNFELNPTWINLGNGIAKINRRGFGDIAYTTDNETGTVLGLDGWDDDTDIQVAQTQSVTKFATKETAMDQELNLVPDDGTVLDFMTQNPVAVYFAINNFASLGMRYEADWIGSPNAETLERQDIYWVQNIVVQFFTSVCAPLGGEGQDPIEVLIIAPPVPPPNPGWWAQIAYWLANLLGISMEWANVIMIAVIAVVLLILVMVLIPGVAPVVGKLFAKLFGWLWRGIVRIWTAIVKGIKNAAVARAKRKAASERTSR